MLSTISAILLRILSNPLANVLQKQLTQRKKSPLLINFMTYFFLSFVCLIFALKIDWINLSSSFWNYAISGGFFGALGNAFLIKALQNGELSVLGPINSYKSIVGVIFGIFILHEIPTVYGLCGIALIVVGSYFVFDTLEEKFSFKLLARKDIQYRLLALVLTAIEAIFIKKVIIESSVIASFMVWCFFGAIFAFLLLLASAKSKLSEIKETDIGKYILLIISIGVMQLTTNYVLKNMNVGYALALFQLSTLVSVGFGYQFFNEKNIRKKLAGAAIMIAGSILVILV